MSRVVRSIALAALLITGCFYSDPINERPSATVDRRFDAPVYRGDLLTLDASSSDLGDTIAWQWTGYACTDGTTASGCDGTPFLQMGSASIAFTVPPFRGDGVTATKGLRVALHGVDEHHVDTSPDGLLALAVEDLPPGLDTSQNPALVVDGVPTDLFALITDAVDPAASIAVAWSVLPPAMATYTLTPASAPMNELHEILTPSGSGAWSVSVTATDPAGGQTQNEIDFVVQPDQPAWIAAVSPIVEIAPDALPISAPTLFSVLEVDDDLDVYPPAPQLPEHGTPQFAWSLQPPGGGAFQPLGDTGASVVVDPAQYSPGDILELRVEIADRAHPFTAIMCADDQPTCSETGDDTKVQRQTWRVEIR